MNDYGIYFSIIVPFYNREKTLKRCLDSILSQSYTRFEVICVDDNSLDQSSNIVHEYEVKDARVRYIRNVNGRGAQAARNEGIRNAKYEWIAFCDSDDEYLPDSLLYRQKKIVYEKFDIRCLVYSNYFVRDLRNGEMSLCQVIKVSKQESYKDLLKHPAPHFDSITCHRSLLEQIGLLDEKCPSFQEWNTSLRLSKIGYCVHEYNALFVYNRWGGDSIFDNEFKSFEGRAYHLYVFGEDIIKYHGRDRYYRMVMWMTKNYLRIEAPDDYCAI